ncbi:unnamed protein product, partial [Darwinula stevensoni]
RIVANVLKECKSPLIHERDLAARVGAFTTDWFNRRLLAFTLFVSDHQCVLHPLANVLLGSLIVEIFGTTRYVVSSGMEPCTWQCDKSCPKKLKCTNMCREICNRKPCNQPCPKKIKKCNHPCTGLCGEPCPPLCRICNPELSEFQIYGNEIDEDARFVYLPDCGHCIEVKAMDQYMKMEMEVIGMKKCPLCHTVIWSSVRYGNIVRQLYRDVAAVKEKAFGDPKKNQDDFLKSFQDLLRQSASSHHLRPEFTILQRKTEVEAKKILNKKMNLSNTQYTPTIINQFEILSFKHQVNFLENLDLATKQVRLQTTVQARIISTAKEELGVQRHPRAMQHIERAKVLLLRPEPFAEEMKQGTLWELDAASRAFLGLGISIKERITSIKTVDLGQGHWYKCPNGHIYAIGSCGEAMKESKCNICWAGDEWEEASASHWGLASWKNQ